MGNPIEQLSKRFLKPSENLVELVWGGSYIEQMKGLPVSGHNIGESWECSGHTHNPSQIRGDDGSLIPLPQIISSMSEEILGKHIAKEFNNTLPILAKFIDAREDLSVQVHPTDAKAKELGETDTGKEEAWIILDAQESAVLYLGFREDVDRDQFSRDLSSAEINIAHKYMNAIPVKVGDVLMNPAGTIHAIGKGIALAEIQQSSGITYRVWDWNRLPPRPLHRDQALESLDFTPRNPEYFRRTPMKTGPYEERVMDSFYFTTDRITLSTNSHITGNTKGCFQILSCLQGEIILSSSDSKETLSRGQSLLIPSNIGEYELIAKEDSILLRSFTQTPSHVDPVIFQTYDVRAIANEYLSDKVVYYLGKGYGTFLRQFHNAPDGKLHVSVGGGIRLSTERIRLSLLKGIVSSGVNVYDVGITSTPELYFSIPYLGADGGINITASHNESEYNGLKQVVTRPDGFITSISSEQMLQIKRLVLHGEFLEGQAKITTIPEGEITRYHNLMVQANCRLGRDVWIYLLKQRGLKSLLETMSNIEFPYELNNERWKVIAKEIGIPTKLRQPPTAIKHPLRGLRVVIDFGNGSGWRTSEVYSKLGAEIVALNDQPDGSFPAHIPDPIKAKYRKQLEEAVQIEADKHPDREVLGIGHDEDADRVIYVRSDGRVVEGDRTLAIQAKALIQAHKQAKKHGKLRFMGEVKFSRVTEAFISSQGGEYIMSPTGFAFIKEGTMLLCQAIQKGNSHACLFGNRIDLTHNKEPIALAAELSGHQMSGHEENWIFDDASLAAVKVLSVIASAVNRGENFISLDEQIPRYPVTPELNIRIPSNVLSEKQEAVDQVIELFKQKGYQIDTTDGGLIQWINGNGEWVGQALIRKSNTQPMIICRVEGRDEQARIDIEDEFFSTLSQVSTKAIPTLDLSSDEYIKSSLARTHTGAV
ncbi:MAG: type I phosphomannose isomerase catalytic subunit [Chloroflexota bacterium]|nr:type I phosphomannose isomerase catalytic subunit [Chloroflexota bacterium]